MSRAYKIRAAASLVHHSKVDDGIEARLELLDILGPERTTALLVEALTERAWVVEGEVARKTIEGVVAEIDIRSGTVRVTAAAQETRSLQTEGTSTTYEENHVASREKLQAALEAQLVREAKAHDEALSQRLADDLEQALVALRPELQEITDQVTRTGLKEKASQLGQIMEISENAESGEMTIRVKV